MTRSVNEMPLSERLDRLHWFVTAMRRWASDNQVDFHKEIVESLQTQFESVARHELETTKWTQKSS